MITVIIGAAGSGKTHVAEQIATPDDLVIHTDDFIQYGFEQSLYELLDFIGKQPAGTSMIIEGVGVYRLLRKGVELDIFYPDKIIDVVAPEEQRKRVYEDRPGSYAKTVSQQKGNETVWGKYVEMLKNKGKPMPEFVTLNNIF